MGGNGAKRLILARLATAVNAVPTDATTYTADAAFGVGTQIGTGNYVVYNGPGTSVTVTGLRAGNTYTFAVFEYNDNDTPFAENYRTAAPGTLAQATPAAPAAPLPEENFANFHLGPSPLSTNFRSRVFVRRNAATGKVQFGISGSAAATYGTTDYELNTTYLLVVKYSFDETGNLAQLFVNPAANAEPTTADVSAAEAASTSPANIGTVALRQGASSPNLVVDGLRVGTAYQVVRMGPVRAARADGVGGAGGHGAGRFARGVGGLCGHGHGLAGAHVFHRDERDDRGHCVALRVPHGHYGGDGYGYQQLRHHGAALLRDGAEPDGGERAAPERRLPAQR